MGPEEREEKKKKSKKKKDEREFFLFLLSPLASPAETSTTRAPLPLFFELSGGGTLRKTSRLSPAPDESSVSHHSASRTTLKKRNATKETMPAFFGLEERGCSTDAAAASILPRPLPPTPDSVTGPSTQAASELSGAAPSAGTPTAPPSPGQRRGPATALAEELSSRLRLDDGESDDDDDDDREGEEMEPAMASPSGSFASDFGDEADRVLESITVSGKS